ncbi:ABC transporter permease [Kibdelosporangium aridum]|uniref:ABC transporter permease n=1 Tax=Kibdelosporangium aridum TaxID=2030 RepID=A0A428ZL37_KIBAR|nr:ABC transporter permease [Kibdelosporangium aridum]RSM88671.1 ABC transporter permease [Kibdelosporangium aridum]
MIVATVARSKEAILVVLAVGAVVAHPGTLLSTSGLVRTALVASVAIGLLFVVVAGGIDLSAGPVAAVAVVGLPYGLLIGLACGLINGVLVARTRIPPYLVTLATCALVVSAGPRNASGDATRWFGVPAIVWVAVVIVIAAHIVLTRTRTGLHVYFVGSNADGARLSGIRPGGVRILVYVTSGVLAALAGALAGPELPHVGIGVRLEFLVLIAVLIGGASLSGGRGTVLGTVLGSVLCVQMLAVMDVLDINEYGQQCVQIAVLLLLAAFNERRQALVRPT